MFVSFKHKIVFIHNHKSGGMSTEQWLARQCSDLKLLVHRHQIARDAKAMLERDYGEDWSKFTTFGFVRNPWARLVSWWAMIEENPTAHPNLPFWQYVRANARTFEEFVLRCTDEIQDVGTVKIATRPQLDYFKDLEGNIIVDFIGRFENLQQDLNKIAKRCDLQLLQVPHHNATSPRDYREMYTPELREIVAERFKDDIEMFGYVF